MLDAASEPVDRLLDLAHFHERTGAHRRVEAVGAIVVVRACVWR